MSDVYCLAPRPCHRLIPSRFPPIGLFDTVAKVSDLAPVMELAGWTNDRLVTERIRRLPQAEWVYGIANASIVMASFLHVASGGMRFNNADLGAWYAAAALSTAAAEVGHHLRREAVALGAPAIERQYREYSAVLSGAYLDIRGLQQVRADLYDSVSYAASQPFGEAIRAAGKDGIVYDSLRHVDGVNVAAHRPRHISEITQAGHFSIRVRAASSRIDVRRILS